MSLDYINKSLCQIKGVPLDLERQLKAQGILNIDMLYGYAPSFYADVKIDNVRQSIKRFNKAIELDLLDYIVNSFPIGQRSRVIHDYYNRVCFLDIETEDTSSNAKITTISVSFNGYEKSFVRGNNLDDFLDVWSNSGILVTFNGTRFDIPKIMSEFNLTSSPAHIDLLCEAKYYGLKGGLKHIETIIGYTRENSSAIDGFKAIDLWNQFKATNNIYILDQLLQYNLEDVHSLIYLYKHLFRFAIENLVL